MPSCIKDSFRGLAEKSGFLTVADFKPSLAFEFFLPDLNVELLVAVRLKLAADGFLINSPVVWNLYLRASPDELFY